MGETTGNHSMARTAFALVIVSFLLSTTVSLVSMHLMNRQNEQEVNRVLTTQIYDYMNAELSKPITAARTMSSSTLLADALMNESQVEDKAFTAMMADYLGGIEDGLGYSLAFVVSDASGRYYTRSGLSRTVDPDDEQDAWYASFAESGALYDLDVDSDKAHPNDLIVFVNAKVSGPAGQFLGICGVGVRITGIQELFRAFEESFNVKIDLVNTEGIVQVDAKNENIETMNLSSAIAGKDKHDYVYEDLGGGKFAVTKYMEDLDWFLVVQSAGASDAGKFANVILLNVILCLVVLVALFVALRIAARRANALASESLTDHLTGLHNKRAFERDKAQLASMPLDDDFVFVTADLNGLKVVNDTLGHDAGDAFVKGAADCLRASFGKRGTVYRIGGDEFAALLHVPADGLESLKRDLARATSTWEGESVNGMSLSCGYASVREHPRANIEDLGALSDKRMYEDKNRYYETTGLARR